MLDRSEQRSLEKVLLLALLVVFCLYLPSVFHQIFADDNIYLAFSNRLLRDSGWSDVYRIFLGPANPWEYLPVRDLTYWLDFRLFGDEPAGFHASNLIWYALACFGCYCFTSEVIRGMTTVTCGDDRLLSLSVTLLFAVHPAHVEAVVWIASRKDVLAGAFSFFGFAFLLRGLRTKESVLAVAVGTICFLLACFSKASAITGILVITVLCGMGWSDLPSKEKRRRLLILSGCWLLAFAAALVHYRMAELTGVRIENSPGAFAMLDRASRILVTLVKIVVVPGMPRLYYDVYEWGDWHWIASLGLLVLGVSCFFLLFRKGRLLPFSALVLLAPLAVYLQLTPFSTWSMASDRFVFLSVTGVCLAYAGAALWYGASPQRIAMIALIIAVPMATIVWIRVNEWESQMTLMDREREVHPLFHNVLRDEVAYRLIPRKAYEEALVLAAQVSRPYAAEALSALILTHWSYRALRDAPNSTDEQTQSDLVRSFCSAVQVLKGALAKGGGEIKGEPDVTYNNLLRTAEHALKYQYADERRLCVQSSP